MSGGELRAALEALELAVLVRTLEGVVLMVNDAFVRMLGYSRAEVVGQDIKKLLCPDGRRVLDEFNLKIRNGQARGLSGVTMMVCKDETVLHVRFSVTTVARSGQTLVVGLLQDWSDIHWANPAYG